MGACCTTNSKITKIQDVNHPIPKHLKPGDEISASFVSRQTSVMKSGIQNTNFYCD